MPPETSCRAPWRTFDRGPHDRCDWWGRKPDGWPWRERALRVAAFNECDWLTAPEFLARYCWQTERAVLHVQRVT